MCPSYRKRQRPPPSPLPPKPIPKEWIKGFKNELNNIVKVYNLSIGRAHSYINKLSQQGQGQPKYKGNQGKNKWELQATRQKDQRKKKK